MNERPIMFSGEMVRAILDGRKTQTRRVVKAKPPYDDFDDGLDVQWAVGKLRCPYGVPGDRLYVREAFWIEHDSDIYHGRPIDCGINLKEDTWARIWYCATDEGPLFPGFYSKRPSIHMPKWASRITLEVTAVRVERVQDIDNHESWREGIPEFNEWSDNTPKLNPDRWQVNGQYWPEARDMFAYLWDSINAKRGYSWQSNPWVWVVEFRVC